MAFVFQYCDRNIHDPISRGKIPENTTRLRYVFPVVFVLKFRSSETPGLYSITLSNGGQQKQGKEQLSCVI